MSKGKKRPGGNPATAAARKADAQARGLGLHHAFEKAQLDALHEVSLDRFGVGIGVVVQEEERLKREAKSHAAERKRLPWRARLYFPFGQYHRLRRMAEEAQGRSDVWASRMRICVREVARRADQATVDAFRSEQAVAQPADER